MRKEFRKLLFIFPGLMGTVLFYLLPLIYCVFFSFSASSGRFTFVGLRNFLSLFGSDTFVYALIRTYGWLLLFVAVILLLSIAAVYVLDAAGGRFVWLVGLSLPLLLPSTVIVKFTEELAISPVLLLLLIFLWKYIGFHILLLKTMERTMPLEWTEAAVLEKARKSQVFVKIRLPFLWPYLRFLIIFDGICFFRLFRESYLLYGQYPPEEIYMITNFFFNNFQNLNYQRLSAAATMALLPILIFHGILLKAGEKHEMV